MTTPSFPQLQRRFKLLADTVQEIEILASRRDLSAKAAVRQLKRARERAEAIHQAAPTSQISTESMCLWIDRLIDRHEKEAA